MYIHVVFIIYLVHHTFISTSHASLKYFRPAPAAEVQVNLGKQYHPRLDCGIVHQSLAW